MRRARVLYSCTLKSARSTGCARHRGIRQQHHGRTNTHTRVLCILIRGVAIKLLGARVCFRSAPRCCRSVLFFLLLCCCWGFCAAAVCVCVSLRAGLLCRALSIDTHTHIHTRVCCFMFRLIKRATRITCSFIPLSMCWAGRRQPVYATRGDINTHTHMHNQHGRQRRRRRCGRRRRSVCPGVHAHTRFNS